MSTVSVVIPCYKYGHFLADCVKSVLDEQEGVDVRVLIIDDASPDDSADVARALAAADPRIEVRVHERNQGTSRPTTRVCWSGPTGTTSPCSRPTTGWSRGPWCAPPPCSTPIRRPASPTAGRCASGTGGPLPAARTRSTGSVVYPGRWWLDRRFREGTGCITSPEVVVRTSLQRKVGGYDPELPHAGDIEMWMRLAAHADVGYVQGADQAFYRVHGDNMSTTDFGGQLDDLRQRLVAFDSVLDKCGDLLPGSDLLAVAARTRLARYALRRAYRAYDRGRTAVVPVDELVEVRGRVPARRLHVAGGVPGAAQASADRSARDALPSAAGAVGRRRPGARVAVVAVLEAPRDLMSRLHRFHRRILRTGVGALAPAPVPACQEPVGPQGRGHADDRGHQGHSGQGPHPVAGPCDGVRLHQQVHAHPCRVRMPCCVWRSVRCRV
ncbi:hypothetical protein Scinn_44390 [Streptomyces virginiae]|uniref:Glycosyltransferase 2-like domain-containing protein n=1 Tax=Streptomyces virginiae TaxID=1961 RepID=A0ABQ3NQE5_STRVG|nr:glycosyltransferase [Streptomyces virginiae]GHI14976.1 hypothetical protein Scinn_44390 [Streptomyces virginiae]